MAKIYVSTVIDAPIEKVWPIIRDFNGLAGWMPGIVGCSIDNGKTGTEIGAIRNMDTGQPDITIREQLLGLSDLDHSCTYSVVEGPLPLSNLIATIRLHTVTDAGSTFGEWAAEFDPNPGAEEKAPKILTKVFSGGWASLKERIAS